MLFALDVRHENRAATRLAFGVETPGGPTVLTWDSDHATTGHYASRAVIDILHRQDAPTTLHSGRYDLVDLSGDLDGLLAGRILIRRRLPTLYLTGTEATTAIAGGTAVAFALDRTVDRTGINGTDRVALGLELPSGAVVLSWLSPLNAVFAYQDVYAVDSLHGHGSQTLRSVLTAQEDIDATYALFGPRLPAILATAVQAAFQLDLDLLDLITHAEQRHEQALKLLERLPWPSQYDVAEADHYERQQRSAQHQLQEAIAALPRPSQRPGPF